MRNYVVLTCLCLLLIVVTGCNRGSATTTQVPENESSPAPKGKPDFAAGPPPVQVEVRTVQTRPFRVVFSLTGTTLPYRQAEVAAGVSGIVTDVHVRDGQQVAVHAPLVNIEENLWQAKVQEQSAYCDKLEADLARLRAGYLREEIAQKRAAVKESKVDLQRLSAELKRKEELYYSKNLSATEWDQARFSQQAMAARLEQAEADLALVERGFRSELVQAAEADLRSAQAQLVQAKDSLQKAQIKAPFAGVVVQKKVEIGEWMNMGSVVVSLADVSKIKVEVAVPEQYIQAITMGMRAQVALDALPGREITGEVIEIVPKVSPGTRNFPVRFLVDNARGEIAWGMFCRVSGIVRQSDKALLLHGDAILRRDKKSFAIKLMPDNMAEFVPVSLGEREGDWFEVLDSGNKLSGGDKVVVTNNPQVYPGARLMVVREYQ